MPLLLRSAITASSLLLALPALAGGPLSPPGPPSETPGPEPRIAINDLPGDSAAMHIITEPGSYYLSGDVEVTTTGMHGVLIDAPGSVSIDGMGFSVIGVPGAGSAFRIVDDTTQPLRYKLSRCWVKSWSTSGDADSGPNDTNPSIDDLLILDDVHTDQTDSGLPSFSWDGDLIVRNSTTRGGGIFNDGGTLTISHSTISGNAAQGGTALPAIDADGLFMTNVEVRGGAGVKAKKPREIVVVGSKVKDVVGGLGMDLAAGAVVSDTQVDGSIDGEDFLVWKRNRSFVDLADPAFTPSTFGVGSRIEESEFFFDGTATTGDTGIVVTEQVTMNYCKIEWNASGTPTSIVRFTGNRGVFSSNTLSNIPAGAAGLEMSGILHVVSDNTFFGRGMNSMGVMGSAARSQFRNNTMMDVDTGFSLTGAGLNYIGAELTPLTAGSNDNPDRNIRTPPIDPVR